MGAWILDNRRFLYLFAFALALRLAYSLPLAEFVPINDMAVYRQLAENMLAGRGYISSLEPYFFSLRPPGYPFFLMAVFTGLGYSPVAVAAVQSLLGALTCTLVQLIGETCMRARVGLIA
ncbi:MAG: hypothetical protein JRG82_10030, partial [Deltaproteobacteria bacterium]|nr:hypothetical protein [Deltaproteobacteria bacterium]